MNKMAVIIPSRGRADFGRQVTMRGLVDAGIRPTIVVPQKEEKLYRGALTNVSTDIVGCPVDGISATRAWIFDKWSRQKIIMLDDDMYFYRRPKMAEPKLIRCDDYRMKTMLGYVEGLLGEKGYAMVGISARQGNNFQDKAVVENTRAMNAYAFDVPMLRKAGIKFGRVPVMEDFDIILQLLRNGYPNAVVYRYCWNQVGSNASGGCSDYRTAKLQAKAAHILKGLHPEFVTVVTKKSLSAWKGMETRTDVRVAWAKAARSGQ